MAQHEQTHRPVALVTGAASGIGAACARLIMADGEAELVVVDRDEEGLAAMVTTLAHPEDALVIALDVTDEVAWARATVMIEDRFGRLDWVVASAGVAFGAAITDTRLEDWRRILAINLDGCF
jgi:NADP-dependent 3-hydroxy acid dehydrogenase YdfG